MTILIFIGVIIFIGVLINLISSKDTKLLRRVWSAEKYSNFDAQLKALNELLVRFGIEIKRDVKGVEKNKLEEKMLKLIGKAIEFDVRHPHNSGIKVVSVIIRHLRSCLKTANIDDFDDDLHEMQKVNYAEMARAMNTTLSQMGNGRRD